VRDRTEEIELDVSLRFRRDDSGRSHIFTVTDKVGITYLGAIPTVNEDAFLDDFKHDWYREHY